MKIIVLLLAASVMVWSSPQVPVSGMMLNLPWNTRPFFYHLQPPVPRWNYNYQPSYPHYYYPMPVESNPAFNIETHQKNQDLEPILKLDETVPLTIDPSFPSSNQELSYEDDKAMAQLNNLKNIQMDGGNEVLLPSMNPAPSPRLFFVLKLVSSLSLGFSTITRTKTKLFVLPTIG